MSKNKFLITNHPLFFSLMLMASVQFCVAEENWPRFRGVNGTGVSDAGTVPSMWNETNYNWKVTLPGVGHSSPVVWGSRVFVTSGDATTARRIIMCIDKVNGRTLWQREYESKVFKSHVENSYATATPAADTNGVLISWTTPGEVILLALDNDGKEIWRRDLGPFVGIHGSGTSPIIVDGFVVYNNDQEDPAVLPNVYAKAGVPKTAGRSFLVALDRGTGKTRWQLERRSNQASYVTPCINISASGLPEIILTSTAHGFSGVDLATGRLNWELPDVFKERCVGSPVTCSGLIIAGEGRGSTGLRIVAVRPGVSARVAYEVQKPIPLVPTPLARGDRLFLWADDGNVTCLKAVTGELVWREHVSGMFYSSPVFVNNRIYCVSKLGDVVVIAAAEKFELIARIPLGEKCFATPAVAGGVMYLRTFSRLFSLGGVVR